MALSSAETEINSFPTHTVSVMLEQCILNCTVAGKFVLTKKQRQSRVFAFAASTHTLELNLDCPLFLCSSESKESARV